MISLRLGDARKLIKKIDTNSIDFIFTDPPYNIRKYSTGNISLPNRSPINNDIADWDDKEIDYAFYANEFKRVLKKRGNIFIFTSYHVIGKWHQVLDKEFDTFQFFVWHKTNPTPKIARNGFLNSCEIIVCAWNKGHTWNFSKQNLMHNFFESSICMGNERIKDPKHPTQKPVLLLKHIVKIASNPGDVIFDPFMGLGSSGIAAIELNRRYIGIEIDKKYYQKASDRLNSTNSKFKIGNK
jgi:site-specific DNA-methyltransferase (adenine-specific)/modification methylase